MTQLQSVFVTTSPDVVTPRYIEQQLFNRLTSWINDNNDCNGVTVTISGITWQYRGTPIAIPLNEANTLTMYALAHMRPQGETYTVVLFYVMDTTIGRCFKGLYVFFATKEIVEQLPVQTLFNTGLAVYRQQQQELLAYEIDVKAIKAAAGQIAMHFPADSTHSIMKNFLPLLDKLLILDELYAWHFEVTDIVTQESNVAQNEQQQHLRNYEEVDAELIRLASILSELEVMGRRLGRAFERLGESEFKSCLETMVKHATEAQHTHFEPCEMLYPFTTGDGWPHQAHRDKACSICHAELYDEGPRLPGDPKDPRPVDCENCETWAHRSCFMKIDEKKCQTCFTDLQHVYDAILDHPERKRRRRQTGDETGQTRVKRRIQ